MSFVAQEQGVETGSPVELYDINYANQSWYYTSCETAFYDTPTNRNYAPLMIDRGNIQYTGDLDKSSLEIKVQNDAQFLDLFRAASPSGVVSLTVRRYHRNDGALEIVQMWKGRIISVNWEVSTCTLLCEPIRASVQRVGLRRIFQRNCPHTLYSAACGASKAFFEVLGTVESISGNLVNVTGVSIFAANYFAGGFVEYVNTNISVTERRLITSNPGSTNQLVLMTPTIGLEVGAEIRVYPGCDHTIATCNTKFSNSVNFGGKPYTPTKNPFGGEPIY